MSRGSTSRNRQVVEGDRDLARDARLPPEPSPASADAVSRLMMLTAIAKVLNLILLDIAVVLVERARELVRAVVAADEVQIVGVGRMHAPPRATRGRATRSARAAGRDSDRCCTASRTTDRPCGCCRRSGPPSPARRSPSDRTAAACRCAAASCRRRRPAAARRPSPFPSRRSTRASPPGARVRPRAAAACRSSGVNTFSNRATISRTSFARVGVARQRVGLGKQVALEIPGRRIEIADRRRDPSPPRRTTPRCRARATRRSSPSRRSSALRETSR